MSKRQLRLDELDGYEWFEVREAGSEEIVYIPTFKKADIPPLPDKVHVYALVETTKNTDTERKYKWVPVLIYD